MTVMGTDVPALGQISNRHFASLMQLWGWKVSRRKGRLHQMRRGSAKVWIYAPHTHKGNSAYTINEVLAATGVDWPTFLDKEKTDGC